VSDRRPPEITESIAESLRAGLALLAVVLLVRANAGAFTRTPSVWMGLLVGLIVWGTAVWAARWTRLAGVSRLAVWRDCVAPATISLVMAGRGGAGTLPMAIGLLVVGSLAMGFAAAGCCQTGPDCKRGAGEIDPVPLNETLVEEPIASPPQRGSAPCSHAGLAVTLLKDAVPAALAEIVESSIDAPSPVESWTRMESDGDVSIEAVIQARFDEGSKRAVVHVPFVPPLPSVPQIECEPLDSGCEVEIQTEAAYRHGARLSVTRPTAGLAESVPIGVVVYTSAEEPVES
jgi:hypothetical protein